MHGGSRHPKSRASTAGMHPNISQPRDQRMVDSFSQYLPSHQPTTTAAAAAAAAATGHHVFAAPANNPEDMIMRFDQQFSQQTAGTAAALSSSFQEQPHAGIPSHMATIHGAPLSHHSLTPDLIPHGIPEVPSQYQTIYDTSGVESHVPEHIWEDHESSEAGSRKKKGAGAAMANDNELRKLLRQYEGYTLKQMAVEVVKNEGNGGKSEKVKQVFAMIW